MSVSGLFSNLLEPGINAFGLQQYKGAIEDRNATDVASMDALMEETRGTGSFKPFAVTSSTGNVNVDSTGGHQVQLTPEQQALADQLRAGSGSMFASALAGPEQYEQGIYDKIRAMQSPQEAESRLALENRALQQGRLGLSLNNLGGSTPEMMALQRGLNEQDNAAAVSAIDLGRAQQLQDFNMAQGMLSGQYAGENQMLQNLAHGTQNSANAGLMQRDTGGLLAQMGLGKIASTSNMNKELGQLLQQQYAAAAGVAGNVASSADEAGMGLFEYAKQALGL